MRYYPNKSRILSRTNPLGNQYCVLNTMMLLPISKKAFIKPYNRCKCVNVVTQPLLNGVPLQEIDYEYQKSIGKISG